MCTVPSLEIWLTKRISGGHTSVGAMPRSYQVTPKVLRRRRATEPKQVRPNGRQAKRESARRRRETYRRNRTSPTRHPHDLTEARRGSQLTQLARAGSEDYCFSIKAGASDPRGGVSSFAPKRRSREILSGRCRRRTW